MDDHPELSQKAKAFMDKVKKEMDDKGIDVCGVKGIAVIAGGRSDIV